MNTRPISITHLVFGLIFLGAAALWAIGAATDADAPDLAVVAPAVLIGAGVIGLAAIVFNARNARVNAEDTAIAPDTQEPEFAETGVLEDEERK
jgi:hypothetical protein